MQRKFFPPPVDLANNDRVSNLGGTFPKYFILKLVDTFTSATCVGGKEAFSCVLEADKHRCTDLGGTCVVERDGYYITNVICVILGAITFFGFIREAAMRLQGLPLRAWRLTPGTNREG